MTAEIQFVTADLFRYNPVDFKGFSCLITDPPYGKHVHTKAVSANRDGAGYVERDLGFDYLSSQLRNHICKIAEYMSRWSVIFSDYESTHDWRREIRRPSTYIREVPYIVPRDPAVADTDVEYMFELPWERWSQPQKSGDRPGQQSEAVLHFHAKGKKHWNGPGTLVSYKRKALRGRDKHPTEKPLDLMLDIVSWFSDVGDSVVDVCAGSGTTALACFLLDRDCLAIEKDPKWEAVARSRLALEWSGRDAERVRRWVYSTRWKANRLLAKKRTFDKDGRPNDEKTRARARARLDDVTRVLVKVGELDKLKAA